MAHAFTLKRTVIGGQTSPDEWSIMLNGEIRGPNPFQGWQPARYLPVAVVRDAAAGVTGSRHCADI